MEIRMSTGPKGIVSIKHRPYCIPVELQEAQKNIPQCPSTWKVVALHKSDTKFVIPISSDGYFTGLLQLLELFPKGFEGLAAFVLR